MKQLNKHIKFISTGILLLCAFFTNAQFILQAPNSTDESNYRWFDASDTATVLGTASAYNVTLPGVYFALYDGTRCGKNASTYFIVTYCDSPDNQVILDVAASVGPSATINWSPAVSGDQLRPVVTAAGTVTTYTATVTKAGHSKALPSFTVVCLIRPFALVNDFAVTDQGTPIIIDILANDIDLPSAGVLTTTSPANGSLTIDDNGTPGDPSDDSVTYTPNAGFNGTDSFDYTITVTNTDGTVLTNTATVTITVDQLSIAVVDDVATGINGTNGQTAVVNVLQNDTLDGVPVTLSEVTLTEAIADPNGYLTLNPDGTVDVAAGTPAGTYTLTYQICEILNPTNCDTAVVGITVDPPAIQAMDDTNINLADGINGQGSVLNVLDNDTSNGSPINPADVSLMETDPDPTSALSLNPDGTVDVAANTPSGLYTLQYQICDVLSPMICDTATVIISVDGDNDGDGISDSVDLDDDNDGIPDLVEEDGIVGRDTDGDGIPDIYDLDSDGDGIYDVHESGNDGIETDGNGTIDGPYGANGLADAVETLLESGVVNYDTQDTDGDGEFDFQDVDDDGDGVHTTYEDPNPDGDNNPNTGNTMDTDSDGIPDYLDGDDDGDTLLTEDENSDPNNDGMPDDAFDADSDGVPDYLQPNNADPEEEIQFYNVLTPNGDGDHDRLVIGNLENFPDNNIKIYNRWGVVIYETEGYGQNGNYFTGASDGRVTFLRESMLPTGTYYYLFTYINEGGGEVKKAGYIYITR